MSLRRAFRSRKFSKSFRELKAEEEDQARGGRRLADHLEDRVSDSSSSSASSWSAMLPELLGEIMRRVEASDERWPNRRNVVACACVCKRWRDVAKEIARSPSRTGRITFPSCLKQVSSPWQCQFSFSSFTFPCNFVNFALSSFSFTIGILDCVQEIDCHCLGVIY